MILSSVQNCHWPFRTQTHCHSSYSPIHTLPAFTPPDLGYGCCDLLHKPMCRTAAKAALWMRRSIETKEKKKAKMVDQQRTPQQCCFIGRENKILTKAKWTPCSSTFKIIHYGQHIFCGKILTINAQLKWVLPKFMQSVNDQQISDTCIYVFWIPISNLTLRCT